MRPPGLAPPPQGAPCGRGGWRGRGRGCRGRGGAASSPAPGLPGEGSALSPPGGQSREAPIGPVPHLPAPRLSAVPFPPWPHAACGESDRALEHTARGGWGASLTGDSQVSLYRPVQCGLGWPCLSREGAPLWSLPT